MATPLTPPSLFYGIAFPFSISGTSFPAGATDEELIQQSIIQIILTPKGSRCFSGDTRVPLLNGAVKALEELAGTKEAFYVYSINPDNGTVVPGKAKAYRTGTTDELLKVTLDNGETVLCTPEHLWLQRDGSYVEAQHMQEGTSLMPLYRLVSSTKNPRGYEIVKTNNTWEFTHRVVAAASGVPLKGMTVHHKNFNKLDNDPRNLQVMTPWDHHKLHLELGNSEKLQTPSARAKAKASIRKRWEDPEFAARHKERLSRLRTKTNKRPKEKQRLKIWSRAMGKKFWTAPEMESQRQRNREALLRGYKADLAKGENSSLRKGVRNWWLTADERVIERRVTAATMTLQKINQSGEAQRNRALALIPMFLAANPGIDLSEKSWTAWSKTVPGAKKGGTTVFRWATMLKYIPELNKLNHKVVSIERLSAPGVPVYDLHVEDWHNFALEAGVFVHNCMRPDFGSNALTYVFENNSDLTAQLLDLDIRNSLAKFEPRIIVQRTELFQDGSTLTITINYVVILTKSTSSVSITLGTK